MQFTLAYRGNAKAKAEYCNTYKNAHTSRQTSHTWQGTAEGTQPCRPACTRTCNADEPPHVQGDVPTRITDHSVSYHGIWQQVRRKHVSYYIQRYMRMYGSMHLPCVTGVHCNAPAGRMWYHKKPRGTKGRCRCTSALRAANVPLLYNICTTFVAFCTKVVHLQHICSMVPPEVPYALPFC